MKFRKIMISIVTVLAASCAYAESSENLPDLQLPMDHHHIVIMMTRDFLSVTNNFCLPAESGDGRECEVNYSKEVVDGFSTLVLGLSSSDIVIRDATAQMVESIIYKVATSKSPLGPTDDINFYRLLLMYKIQGAKLIGEMEKYHPQSPVLVYLSRLN